MLARGRVPSYTAPIPMERTRLVGMQKRTESGQCQNSFEFPQGARLGRACARSGGLRMRGLPALATVLLLTTVPTATAKADELAPEDRGAVDDRRWEHRVSMRRCYEARGWQLRMADDDGLTADGYSAVRAVMMGYNHGLDLRALQMDEIDQALGALGEASADRRAAAVRELDLVVTDALMRLAFELRYNHEATVADGDVSAWRAAGIAELCAAQDTALEAELDALSPSMASYKRLVAALSRYRRLQSEGGWPTLTGEIDATSPPELIAELRSRLAIENYLLDTGSGEWDEELSQALARFQQAHHISPPVDQVGPSTLDALNVPIDQRVAELVVTLDAMRETARGVDGAGQAVWVNVAGFYVEVWEDADRLYRTRAIVGNVNARGRNRTPLFSDVLERLEVNPSWYPPPRLAANLSPDPSRGIVEQGGRLIQLPGPENVLGRVKFLFPNPHAVYLHDTNNRALFDRNTRAYSSGCVRIEDPIELAALLVSRDQSRDYDETMSWLNGILETTRTEVVPLQTQLPVHLEYYTVYVADDGIVEFHGDIYRLNRTQIREVARRHDIALDHSFDEEG